MKKAKRKLGDVDDVAAATTPTAPRKTLGREGARDIPSGDAKSPKSVESMLQEFSAGGADAPVTGKPLGARTTSCGSSPRPIPTPASPTNSCCSIAGTTLWSGAGPTVARSSCATSIWTT